MATKEKGPNTPIIVAIIGLIGVLGAAIIANWNTFFPPKGGPQVEPPIESSGGSPSVEPPPEPAEEDESHAERGLAEARLEEACKEAENIAIVWGEAWWTGRMDTVVELSTPPFWYDVELVRSRDEVVSYYKSRLVVVGRYRFHLDQMSSGTIGELKESGRIAGDHTPPSELRLADNDIYVLVVYHTGPANGDTLDDRASFILYFRRSDEGVQLVGFDG